MTSYRDRDTVKKEHSGQKKNTAIKILKPLTYD